MLAKLELKLKCEKELTYPDVIIVSWGTYGIAAGEICRLSAYFQAFIHMHSI